MKDCGHVMGSQVKNKIRSFAYLVYKVLSKNFFDSEQTIELVRFYCSFYNRSPIFYVFSHLFDSSSDKL